MGDIPLDGAAARTVMVKVEQNRSPEHRSASLYDDDVYAPTTLRSDSHLLDPRQCDVSMRQCYWMTDEACTVDPATECAKGEAVFLLLLDVVVARPPHRAFLVAVARVWNELLRHVTSAQSMRVFCKTPVFNFLSRLCGACEVTLS